MAFLVSDWIRESKSYQLRTFKGLTNLQRNTSLLVLTSDWTQSVNLKPHKIYRACEYFKDNLWLTILPKEKIIKISDNGNIKFLEWKDKDELIFILSRFFVQENHILELNSFSELPNILHIF